MPTSLPLVTLRHVSPVWAAAPMPKKTHATQFTHAQLEAFARLARMGSPGASTRPALTPRALFASLGPVFAYRAAGLLEHVLENVASGAFVDAESEVFLQRILSVADARGARMPDGVVQRLGKTVTRTSWRGFAFMWKVAVTPRMPGFALYACSLALLARLAALEPKEDRSMSLVHMAACYRLAVLVQRAWRAKCQKRPARGMRANRHAGAL